MSLPDAKIRSIMPSDKLLKLTDSQSLYLLSIRALPASVLQISFQLKRIPYRIRRLSAGLDFRHPPAARRYP